MKPVGDIEIEALSHDGTEQIVEYGVGPVTGQSTRMNMVLGLSWDKAHNELYTGLSWNRDLHSK